MFTLKSINPFNLKLLHEHDELTDTQIWDKIKLSEQAYGKHRKSGFRERSQKMLKLSQSLKSQKQKLARTITLEMGKPIKESIAEIEKCAWVCEYYAQHAEEFLKDKIVKTDAIKSYVRYEPLGTILAIMPWNFPFWQTFRFAAPNIMAGNTALLKLASNVQESAELIEKLFSEAGFEPGIFQNLCIGSNKVNGIINNDVIKAISLTGSEFAGSEVASQAAGLIKKSVLELGGSNGFVVLSDANLEKAISTGLKARMQNGGQSCIAAKRFILEKEIAEHFITGYTKNMKTLKTGDPLNEDTDIGPLSSVEQAKMVEDQVNKSISMGARLILGGKRKDAFYPPTILDKVTPGMPVFEEEVFGPVSPMIIANDSKQALELSNMSSYGLGLSVFTCSEKNASMFIENAEEGAVFINEMVKSDPRLPFGGIKKSGIGRELSSEGIIEFMNIKTVYMKGV